MCVCVYEFSAIIHQTLFYFVHALYKICTLRVKLVETQSDISVIEFTQYTDWQFNLKDAWQVQ